MNYFYKRLQRVSIVVTKSEEQTEKMVSKDFDRKDQYKFDRIQECELTMENIIHTK